MDKKLVFLSGTRKALLSFPNDVRVVFSDALLSAQRGLKHEKAKPMKGFGGAHVMEIRERSADGTYRVVYTTIVKDTLYILHAFQKKSTKGIATPKKELDVIRGRLKMLRG